MSELPIKTTTWDFTCNSELTEGYCDVCAMDDTEDYGTVEITRVNSEEETMTVKTRFYRKATLEDRRYQLLRVVLVNPDTRLQTIKDASKCKHGNIYGHIKPTGEWNGVGPSQDDWCDGAPELAGLLDALTEEER